jgi:hypothetical protein
MTTVDTTNWGKRNWAPPNGFPLPSHPEFPEAFDWTAIPGIVIEPPEGEKADEWRTRNDRNLDLFMTAADDYSARVEAFIDERKAAVKEQKKANAKRKRDVNIAHTFHRGCD